MQGDCFIDVFDQFFDGSTLSEDIGFYAAGTPTSVFVERFECNLHFDSLLLIGVWGVYKDKFDGVHRVVAACRIVWFSLVLQRR